MRTINNSNNLSIEKIETKDTKVFKPVTKPLPSHPFRTAIIGSSNGGKSTLILNLLTKESMYMGYFDEIYIWSASIDTDVIWKKLEDLPAKEKDKYRFFKSYEESDVSEILDFQEQRLKNEKTKSKMHNMLFVFDDLIGSKIMTSKVFQSLFFRGRHYNLSLILSFQSWKRIERSLRLNLSQIIITSVTDNELNQLASELCNPFVNKELFNKIYFQCKKLGAYEFLYIDRTADYKDQFMVSFHSKFDIKTKY